MEDFGKICMFCTLSTFILIYSDLCVLTINEYMKMQQWNAALLMRRFLYATEFLTELPL